MELQLVQMYTVGLINPLKTDVMLRRPASLDDAILLAGAYEQLMQLSLSDPALGRGAALCNSRPRPPPRPSCLPGLPLPPPRHLDQAGPLPRPRCWRVVVSLR